MPVNCACVVPWLYAVMTPPPPTATATAMDEWTIRTPNRLCRLFFKIDLLTDFAALWSTDFIDWRYIHSWLVFSTQLVNCCPHGHRNSPPPSQTKCTVLYIQTVGGFGGGGECWIVLYGRMRSSLVVRASDCQCTNCNGPGFDPSIRLHSGIWGAADETVLNIVRKKYKKSPKKIFKKKKNELCCRPYSAGVLHSVSYQIQNLQNCFTTPNKNDQ
jgi:hypothetical protein